MFAGVILRRYFKPTQEYFICHPSRQIIFLHTETCKKILTSGFFSTLEVCCLPEEEQNDREITCQKCVNQFRVLTGSYMLSHLSAHTFGVTMAHDVSAQSVSCQCSDRLSEVIYTSHPDVAGLLVGFWLGFTLLMT